MLLSFFFILFCVFFSWYSKKIIVIPHESVSCVWVCVQLCGTARDSKKYAALTWECHARACLITANVIHFVNAVFPILLNIYSPTYRISLSFCSLFLPYIFSLLLFTLNLDPYKIYKIKRNNSISFFLFRFSFHFFCSFSNDFRLTFFLRQLDGVFFFLFVCLSNN